MKKTKQVKKSKTSKKKIKIKVKYLPWIILVLAIVALALSAIQFIDLKTLTKSTEPIYIAIQDECSYMQGIGLVHQIDSEEDCSIYCKNQCKMQDLEKNSSQLLEIEGECNLCNCYCE